MRNVGLPELIIIGLFLFLIAAVVYVVVKLTLRGVRRATSTANRFCTKCGTPLPTDAEFCGGCGKAQR